MAETRQLKVMPSEPAMNVGNVRVTRDTAIIKQVIGNALFVDFEMEACEALFPDAPELALVYPVLSFNTAERAMLSFYDRLDLGKMEDGAPDVIAWKRKFPEDGGHLYQLAAKLCKWS